MDQWRRIEQLFLAASELPLSDREAFVDRETAGDPALRAAVAGMLRHSSDGNSRFLRAIEQTAVAAYAGDTAPTRIDRYTIVRELGRGGMGTVYLADRSDGEFHQRVAIKVVKRGLDSALVVERFRHERRILASLDHPNIARLFDGGATDGGAPYLVMEYVEGRPIVDHCRERGLPIRDRLQLFAQICAAVQHAHQKLIVHRDIKPANILVTSAGIPKLLDFGIAKLLTLDDEAGSAADALTRVGTRMLTPDYASPEQIRGEPVSVATDVFSLGAVLYELLTGQRAHRFDSYTEAEFHRVICDTEVGLPSHAVEERRLRKQLAGDLDNIVALALRKDPARRYESVEQLASDVQHYLDGRPVSARPETLVYRTRKFVTRNRVPVAAAALVVVSLSVGLVSTIVQARRADAQAARAERRFQEVRKLANTFVFDIYDGMTEIPGTAAVRGRVVTTALQYLDSLAREADGDAALQAELAGAYKRIGDVQGNPSLSGFGQVEASLVSYDKALDILRRLADRPDPDPQVLTDLGTFERNTGSVRLNFGDASGAAQHLRRSIAVWERRNPRRGEDIQGDTGLAQAWGILGQALLALGQSSDAVQSHEAAVDALRGWLPRQTLPTTRGTLSIFLTDLGDAQRDVGDLLGAVEAVGIRKPMVESDPTALNYRRRLHTLNLHLAEVFGHPFVLSLGDAAVAEAHAEEALRAAERMVREDRGSDRSLQDHLWANLTMGAVLLPSEPRRALPYLEAAHQIAASNAIDDAFHQESEASAGEALGHALLVTGDRQRGLDLLRKAAATFERISSRWPQKIDYRFALVRALNRVGDALADSESSQFYRKAYRAAQSIPETPRNVRDLMNQADVHLRWHRWNPAATAAERRRTLDIALRALRTLQSYAPNNRAVQNALSEVRRLLA